MLLHIDLEPKSLGRNKVVVKCDRDADLIRRVGAATALEVRACGAHWAFAPCVAVSSL